MDIWYSEGSQCLILDSEKGRFYIDPNGDPQKELAALVGLVRRDTERKPEKYVSTGLDMEAIRSFLEGNKIKRIPAKGQKLTLTLEDLE